MQTFKKCFLKLVILLNKSKQVTKI